MKTTTSRAFRQKHLNSYTVDDFDNFQDYFFYLHLNRRTQIWHTLGFFLGGPLIPWGLKQALKKKFWPVIIATSLFYGFGYVSHWTEDGQISSTVKNFWPSYWGGILLALRFAMGRMPYHERRFIEKYPHVLWVYQQEAR